MNKLTVDNIGATCRTCQRFHEAHRFICQSWCESTEFYVEADHVCARYVAREMHLSGVEN